MVKYCTDSTEDEREAGEGPSGRPTLENSAGNINDRVKGQESFIAHIHIIIVGKAIAQCSGQR